MSLLQDITIYHKSNSNYIRYNIKASVRNTSYLNRNKTGSEKSDNGLIRVFDYKLYNLSWFCEKGDIIVNKDVYDEIEKAPLTELRNKYGKECVFEVSSVEINVYDDIRLEKVNHIKFGVR